MLSTYIVIGVIVVGIFWAISAYNALVKSRQMVKEGWSGIDVQLKRRSNLIPNLVETVKGYAKHEKGVFEEVTRQRTAAQQAGGAGIAGRGKAEGLLSGALGKLFMVAENYPDLKANQNFIDLQKQLSEVEEQIQLSRRYYNGAARNLNVLVQSFPSVLIARNFGFKEADFFELDSPEEREVPDVKF
jgi:LemA protein